MEDDEPKRAPKKGIPDMEDRRGIGRKAAKVAACGDLKRVKLENVYSRPEKNGVKRMEDGDELKRETRRMELEDLI